MNEAALEVTELQIDQAQELCRRKGLDLNQVPTLALVLAINKQTLRQAQDAP